MKKFLILCITAFLLIGCSGSNFYDSENPPYIDCSETNKIVVQTEKLRFSPFLSGDIEPLISSQCKAVIPGGGLIEIERFDLILRFSDGQTITLPREDFEWGFNFRWIP